MKTMKSLLLAATLATAGTSAFADDNSDSNADAGQAFASQLEGSHAVIVRVPLKADGTEDSTSAEMKVLLTNSDVSSSESAARAFDSGLDASKGAVLPEDSDSNTSGDRYYGWNSWNNYGHHHNYRGYSYYDSYYYNSYRPSYHCGSSYSYSYIRPIYFSISWSGYGHYHYYYYRRGW